MNIVVIQFGERALKSIVEVANEETIVCKLVGGQPRHLELQLLHLHLVEKLSGHLVSLRLLLLLVLQVRSDDIEDAVTEHKAVAQPTLVPDRRDPQILALGNTLIYHARYFFAQRGAREADQEHLEHVDISVLLIDVFIAFAPEKHFQHVTSIGHPITMALLHSEEH